jgi:hypothetical protein
MVVRSDLDFLARKEEATTASHNGKSSERMRFQHKRIVSHPRDRKFDSACATAPSSRRG